MRHKGFIYHAVARWSHRPVSPSTTIFRLPYISHCLPHDLHYLEPGNVHPIMPPTLADVQPAQNHVDRHLCRFGFSIKLVSSPSLDSRTYAHTSPLSSTFTSPGYVFISPNLTHYSLSTDPSLISGSASTGLPKRDIWRRVVNFLLLVSYFGSELIYILS